MRKTLLGCAISVVIASSWANAATIDSGSGRAPENKPNVVVVFLDDAGYADIGVNGGKYPTPNIDKMAEEGQNFSDFYMEAPVSTPSRAALLTSRVSLRTGVYGREMAVFDETDKDGLPKSEYTMAEMFRDSGYSTYMLGKWHLGIGKDGVEHIPTRHGFQEWYGIPTSNDMFEANPEFRLKPVRKLLRDPKVFQNPEVMKMLGERDFNLANPKDGRANNDDFLVPLYHSFSTDDGQFKDYQVGLLNQYTFMRNMTSRAVEYINNKKDDSFFMYVAYPQSHVPIFTSPEYNGVTDTAYGDVMVETDYSVGRIMNALKQNGLDDNTIVVFTSDNGPWLNYSSRGAAGSALPFRAGKSTPYEGGSRVPGIIRWSGQVKPGANSAMYSALDLMPTLASMTGANMPKEIITDGFDQSGNLLKGEESPRDFVPIFMRGELVGFRKGDYKLVFGGVGLVTNGNKRNKAEMYNLVSDEGEKVNLADKEPETYAAMVKLSEEYVASIGTPAAPLCDFDD